MLETAFGHGAQEAGFTLPEEARSWLEERQRNGPARKPDTVVVPTATPGVRLRISPVGQTGPDELLLQLADETGAGEDARLKQKLALTAREAEVLMWVANGKPNRDIAEILGLSPRTVDKHLEQIYAKLGVENRAAAAAMAVRTLNTR
jgi:DNA-binding CsgD family transcriptional regulator